MLTEYKPHPMYHNYVVTNPSLCFDLVIHYVELMNESIVVFPHHHNLYEIFYGVEGTFEFECGGKVEALGPQDFVLLGKDCLHRIRYTPERPASYFTMIFDIVAKTTPAPLELELEYGEIIEELAHIDKEQYRRGHCPQSQQPLLDQIHQEPGQRQLGWLSQTGALYCQFFFNLLRAVSRTNSRIKSPLGYKNIALTASKYIHANYTQDLTIDMVSKALNVTPRHINRLFQEMFGTSFAHTVNTIRMEYSKTHLIHTNESIERIAARVGLPSGKVLTKLFNEQEGISPAKYRSIHRKQAPQTAVPPEPPARRTQA